mgnify:CR=1 FL=1
MQLTTYSDAKFKIENEFDIQDENAIDDDEIMGYFNSAINEADSHIKQLFEDYFLTNDYVPLVAGTSDYDMPTNIYANKFRIVYLKKDAEKYEVKRIKLSKIPLKEDEDDYEYNIENNTGAGGTRFVIYPAAKETSSTILRRWYYRTASRMADDTSVIDIPEFIDFVYAHVRVSVAIKLGHPKLPIYNDKLTEKRAEMMSTLKTMVPDGNTEIEADGSFYEDFDSDIFE